MEWMINQNSKMELLSLQSSL